MRGLVGMLIVLSTLLVRGQARAGVSSAAPLRALVPLKLGFTEFVSWSGSPRNATFNGFSVEVFRMAALRLPFSLTFTFVPFGDGTSDPSYDGMVDVLQHGKVDAIVADITINVERLKVVDFTLPYMQSALVMVAPFKYGSIGTLWDFLQPFSTELWVAVLLAFFGTGMVVFILEHKNPDFHQSQSTPEPDKDMDTPEHTTVSQNRFRRLAQRLVNVYWFTSLTVFFSQQESVTTHAGRFVTVLWLLVVLIFTSSYTASLASTLSAEQPYPTIQGFEFLLKSSVPIGVQGGSFIENYITMLGVKKNRLKLLSSEEQYANELRLGPKNGGVAAIIDELPEVQSFLNTECGFTTVGDQIAYFGGFGFAFAKNSTLTDEMSMAILSLVQDGTMQMLKDKWIGPSQCKLNPLATSHMRFKSFGGLFTILTVVYCICVVWKVLTWKGKSRLVHANMFGMMVRGLSFSTSQGNGTPGTEAAGEP